MTRSAGNVLVFELAGHRYGLAGDRVRELLRAVLITPLPRGPKLVEGVFDLRGTIVPVIDLRQWLNLPTKPLEPADYLIVLGAEDRLLALRVDHVLEFTGLAVAADQSGTGDAVATTSPLDGDWARFEDGLILLPNVESLWSLARSIELKEEAT